MMRVLLNLIRSLWMVGLLAMFGSALPLGGLDAADVRYDFSKEAKPVVAYHGQARSTTVYDGPSASQIGYTVARKPAADKTRNATTGNRVLFARCANCLAAEVGSF